MPTRPKPQKNTVIQLTPAPGGSTTVVRRLLVATAVTTALTAAVLVGTYGNVSMAESSSTDASTAR